MTTTTHPAHGPVSLDRLHQIREILSKAAAQSDGGNLGYAMADAVKVINGVISAEPVGEVSEQRDGLVMDGTVDLGGTSTHRIIKGASKMKRLPIGTKFYITPPAPVMPDVDTIALNTARNIMCDINRMEGWPGGDVQLLACIQSRIEQACRPAMLQAGNSPVTTDGYVLVPIEPTENMIINGFESEPDEFFSKSEEWDAYQEMSGCEQAAHRAKLCWAAMIKAAPQQEVAGE
ncbi:hypothetical protein [Citrobacter freundii]|uniref:hypothetical protein n=1 Tax=Citrobacter freundii TaxID=546 RepID=UPI001F32ED6E|nr:hypothetical protein [Citrobacter freundii]